MVKQKKCDKCGKYTDLLLVTHGKKYTTEEEKRDLGNDYLDPKLQVCEECADKLIEEKSYWFTKAVDEKITDKC